jgi:TIR domain
MKKQIFISLTHADKEIAQAIKDALHALLPYQVEVTLCPNKELDSGIGLGEDWLDWIGERVRTCDFVLALITPTSVSKSGILWELRAVNGATASNTEAERKIRPLLYRVSEDHVPSPLRDNKIHAKRGDDRSAAIALFIDIVEGYKDDIPPELYRHAIGLLENEKRKSSEVISQEAKKSLQELKDGQAVISAYFRMVDAALNAAPPVVLAEEWYEGLFHNAPKAITGVLVMNAGTGAVAQGTIQQASSSAEVFYGFAPNSGENLIGKKLSDLIEMLKEWMDPDDYAAFLADQKNNGTRFGKGGLSAARVPIVFNNEHPTPALRGKSFLPFTLHLSQGPGGSFTTILYLDLKDLPMQLKNDCDPRIAPFQYASNLNSLLGQRRREGPSERDL